MTPWAKVISTHGTSTVPPYQVTCKHLLLELSYHTSTPWSTSGKVPRKSASLFVFPERKYNVSTQAGVVQYSNFHDQFLWADAFKHWTLIQSSTVSHTHRNRILTYNTAHALWSFARIFNGLSIYRIQNGPLIGPITRCWRWACRWGSSRTEKLPWRHRGPSLWMGLVPPQIPLRNTVFRTFYS